MLNIAQNLALQSLPAGVGYNLGADFAGLPVEHPQDGSLASEVSSGLVTRILRPLTFNSKTATAMHVLGLRAYERLIRLNLAAVIAAQLHGLVRLHRFADAVQHEPSRLLRDASAAGDLVAGHAVLAVRKHPHDHHPLVEGDGAVLEDRAHLEA